MTPAEDRPDEGGARILRTFVAFPIAEEVREALGREGRRLAEEVPGLRRVRPEAIHLTLHFLGPTPEGDVPAILEALGRAARGREAIAVRYEGTGAFPSPNRPRVLWVGVVEPEAPGSLAALAGAVQAALRPLGHGGEERAYQAHVTVARAGSARVRALGPLLRRPGAPATFGSEVLSDLRLMVSEPSPQGSRYRALGAVSLPLRTDR